MADVVLTSPATIDVDDILSYLSQQAGRAVADAHRLEFRAAFRRLADHPRIGAPRLGLGRGIRLVMVRPYAILHRDDPARDTVFVLRGSTPGGGSRATRPDPVAMRVAPRPPAA